MRKKVKKKGRKKNGKETRKKKLTDLELNLLKVIGNVVELLMMNMARVIVLGTHCSGCEDENEMEGE